MSKLSFTFYNYVQNNCSDDIDRLKEVFGERLERIPDRSVSSKVLMILLGVETREEYDIFRNVYMDYFRKVVLNDV